MIDQLKQTLKKFRMAIEEKSIFGTTIVIDSKDKDLNNYLIPGRYECTTNSAAQLFENCPAKSAFVLTVLYNHYTKNTNYPTFTQIINLVSGKSLPIFYIRNIDAAPVDDTIQYRYSSWGQIQTTEVQPISSDEELSDESVV